MEQHEDSGSFTPDEHHLSPRIQPDAISPARRRWRAPAVVTSMSVVAALCLYTGSAAHATEAPKAAGVSAVSAVSAQGAGSRTALHVEAAAAHPDGTVPGGVHGAFNIYDGVGGGVEFWFDPTTGGITVAVGTGVGEGGGGVLGTYAYGSVPAPGAYVYASATLAAGTVASGTVSGTYSLDNGVFSGSASFAVDGRTLTIGSDGTTTFDVNVIAYPALTGFTGTVGLQYVYNFNISDVWNYIWNAITDLFTGQYQLEDDDSGDDTTVSGDDGSGSATSDDGSGSSGDDSDDSDDDDGDPVNYSASHTYLPDHASTTVKSGTSVTSGASTGGK
jgi:hypothetical protein